MFRFTPGCCCVLEGGSRSGSAGSGSSGDGSGSEPEEGGSDSGSLGSDSGSEESGSGSEGESGCDSGSDSGSASGSEDSGCEESGCEESGSSGSGSSGSSGSGSQSDTVTVGCCPKPIKRRLILSITASCSHIPLGDYPIIYNDISGRWELDGGPIGCTGPSGGDFIAALRCDSGDWVLDYEESTSAAATSVSCEPLHLTFGPFMLGISCRAGGTIGGSGPGDCDTEMMEAEVNEPA